MKRLMSTLMLCFFVSCIVSCSTKTEFVNKTNNDLPEWFNSTEELSGIGIASPSRGGLKYQLAQAELNAKGNLASKIDSEISRVSKNASTKRSIQNKNLHCKRWHFVCYGCNEQRKLP